MIQMSAELAVVLDVTVESAISILKKQNAGGTVIGVESGIKIFKKPYIQPKTCPHRI